MDESVYAIRRARCADAPGVWRLTRAAWLATYPNPLYKITAEDINEHFDRRAETAVETLKSRLGKIRENEGNFVVMFGVDVIGFCRGARKETYNEIEILNVHPLHHRRGLGAKLWQEARKVLDPKKESMVGVVVHNTNAVGFYRSVGFSVRHEYVFDPKLRLPSGVCIYQKHMYRPAEES